MSRPLVVETTIRGRERRKRKGARRGGPTMEIYSGREGEGASKVGWQSL